MHERKIWYNGRFDSQNEKQQEVIDLTMVLYSVVKASLKVDRLHGKMTVMEVLIEHFFSLLSLEHLYNNIFMYFRLAAVVS